MDGLNDNPQKAAEDIIDQATKYFKFRQSAIHNNQSPEKNPEK